MIKAIIVDDEVKGAKSLEILVKRYCPNIELIGLANNVARALDLYHNEAPDLVFLDIEMPVENGFSFIEKINNANCHIIFTTAYANYGIDAVNAGVSGYLLKPINIDELILVVDKVQTKIEAQQYSKKTVIKPETNAIQNSKLAVTTMDGMTFYDLEDVIYLESDSNYTKLVFTNSKQVLSTRTLKHYESKLPITMFFRPHNSFIINLKYIASFSRSEGQMIKMKNDYLIPLSRSKKKEFLELFDSD
jgi:two-component system, LytTR family, response regulator